VTPLAFKRHKPCEALLSLLSVLRQRAAFLGFAPVLPKANLILQASTTVPMGFQPPGSGFLPSSSWDLLLTLRSTQRARNKKHSPPFISQEIIRKIKTDKYPAVIFPHYCLC